MTQDATITAEVSDAPASTTVVDTTVAVVTPIVVDAVVPAPVNPPVVTAPAPAATVVVAPVVSSDVVPPVGAPSVAAGTITTDTISAVGTSSAEGTVTSALATKLDQAGLIFLGIAGFSPDGQALVQEVLQTGSALTKGTINDILQYSKEMGPTSPVTPTTGSPKQVALYRSLMNGINNNSTDFPMMFATILRIVYELKTNGAFQEKLVYRYFPSMALNTADRQAFAGLIHTLISLSATSGRATAMKQIDFNKLTAFGYTPAGRQRLLSFFNM